MQLEEVQKQKQEEDKIKNGVRNRERAREFHQVFIFGSQGVSINALTLTDYFHYHGHIFNIKNTLALLV